MNADGNRSGPSSLVVDQEMLEPSLDPEMRSLLAGIHPGLMGGEYLPDFLPMEVEIAQAVLKSVTMDVISIRARWSARQKTSMPSSLSAPSNPNCRWRGILHFKTVQFFGLRSVKRDKSWVQRQTSKA